MVDTLVDSAGEIETELGIDGCGLPIVPLSLTHLARGVRHARHRRAADTPERAVADAVREHPYLVSRHRHGRRPADARPCPGCVCKAGADGVHAGALPDGTAFALKIDDGHERARLPLAAALLHRLGRRVDRGSGGPRLAAGARRRRPSGHGPGDSGRLLR